MFQKLNIYLVLAFLLLAVACPTQVMAGPQGPAHPTPMPPPPIMGVNTGVTLSEGDTGELTPSGTLTTLNVKVPLPVDSPPYVEVSPQVARGMPSVHGLAVPQRYQEPWDVNCGAAALGMVLDFLSRGEGAPSTTQLTSDLRRAGLLYEEVGTGVEELAYLARQHGYAGSYAFHDWTLDQLAEQLEQGNPVVVALGANGEGQPGHFVTVTGISDDGAYISYRDPTLGLMTVPVEEFLRVWGLQGCSGLVVQEQPLSLVDDPMLSWIGLLSTLSMLAVLVGRESTRKEWKDSWEALRRKLSHPGRKGLGGKLTENVSLVAGKTLRVPVYEYKEVQKGWKMVPRQVPAYETRMVRTGTKTVTKTVPNMVLKQVKVGTRQETRRVPRYVEKKVRVGWRTEKETVKVTRFRMEPYTAWQKESHKEPVYRTRKYIRHYRSRRVKKSHWVKTRWGQYKKTYYEWKRVPVYGTRKVRVGWKTETRWKKVHKIRQVPYTAYEPQTRRVPVYETRRVQDGYRRITKEVPVFDTRPVQEGWKTVTEQEPVYEKRQVQVGTRTVYDRKPEYEQVKVHTGWKEIPLHGEGDPEKPEKPRTTAEWMKMLEYLHGVQVVDDGRGREKQGPPPWDDELRRMGELNDDEYQPQPTEDYQELFERTMDVYAQREGDNWVEIFEVPQNNPVLIDDIEPEWQMVTQMNAQNVVHQKFLKDLGLNEEDLSNYEPIYFDVLKFKYSRAYEDAQDWYMNQWEDPEDNGFLAEIFELEKEEQYAEFIESIANGYSFTEEY